MGKWLSLLVINVALVLVVLAVLSLVGVLDSEASAGIGVAIVVVAAIAILYILRRKERRLYPRAAFRLPLRLKRLAGEVEPVAVTLLTKNISESGVCFLAQRRIEPGTPVDLEIVLVDKPLRGRRVRMSTAHIVRVEVADTPGWYELAAAFDEITSAPTIPLPRTSRIRRDFTSRTS